ncbi:hypothetical protein M0804_009920 [Polistes exclamans]|nr:hypothetical protein M0804_009920 [Polistes exclamans]
MSPGSQGTLEVERYIGSCLISSNIRNGTHKTIIGKKQELNNLRGKNNTKVCYTVGGQNYGNGGGEQCSMQYGTVSGGWVGAPLISMTSSPRRCNQGLSNSIGQQQQQSQTCEQQQQQQSQQQQQQQQLNGHLHKSPLSRLAIHTQGAPLILAGRFHNRGKIHVGNGSVSVLGSNSNSSNNLAVGGYVHGNGNSSANTMNSTMNGSTITTNGSTRCPVPPRPRRPMDSTKKRTSPNGVVNEQSNLTMTLKPYVSSVSCYDQQRYESGSVQHRNHRRPPIIGRESVYGSCRSQVSSSVQAIADIRQQRYAHRHVQVKVLDDNRNVVIPGTIRAIQSKTVYRPHSHHHHHHHHHHHVVSNNNNNNNNNNVPSRYVHHQDYNDAQGNCEDGSSVGVGGGGGFTDGLGLCQCRYCDPSGLIWDVDQNGYSPYLTAPTCNDFCPVNQYPSTQQQIYLSRVGGGGGGGSSSGSSLGCQDRHQQHQNHQNHHQHQHQRLFDVVECSRLTRSERDAPAEVGAAGAAATSGTAVILRRSWSDPTSYFSEEITTAPSRDVGVIGDRGQSENGSKRCGGVGGGGVGTFWHGDTTASSAGAGSSGSGGSGNTTNGTSNVSSTNGNLNNSAGSPSSKGLEVSTEIVTSPNGHRDLEIKFYSPSPNPQIFSSSVTIDDDNKSIFVEEDEEDFNDIWSYHESKLQQDFRSLLQAEE